MKVIKIISSITVFLLCTFSAGAQSTSWVLMRQGNKAFAEKKYQTAEGFYQKALQADPDNANALYNLGNVNMVMQKDTALVIFDKARQISTNPSLRAKAAHNQGVICQTKALSDEKKKTEFLKQAISYYKSSLRDNPGSDATRYNLALCQKQLKDSRNNSQKSPQDNQQNKKKKEENTQQQNSMVNYARQAEQKTRTKMQKNANRHSLDKNW